MPLVITVTCSVLTLFTVQEVSKKDRAMDAKGGSNTKDIRIENFDVAFGDRSVTDSKKCLLK